MFLAESVEDNCECFFDRLTTDRYLNNCDRLVTAAEVRSSN